LFSNENVNEQRLLESVSIFVTRDTAGNAA